MTDTPSDLTPDTPPQERRNKRGTRGGRGRRPAPSTQPIPVDALHRLQQAFARRRQ
jgi:hypothetical protein